MAIYRVTSRLDETKIYSRIERYAARVKSEGKSNYLLCVNILMRLCTTFSIAFRLDVCYFSFNMILNYIAAVYYR